jgi:hypothetical protein
MNAFGHRYRFLTLLRASLVLGALYDLAYAVVMVVAPEGPAQMFKLPLPPLPEGAFYFWVMATLLAMLAVLYLAAARDPRRYSAVIAVAIVGRAVGALAFALAALNTGLSGLYPMAAADFAFALAHAVFWWPIRS